MASVPAGYDDGLDQQPELAESGKNTFMSNIGLLKSLGGQKKTRDGQPAKRRGPKPDSKPALTRRQELNRQAQRTHRERKEQYIRALEGEISRLREAYSNDMSSANSTVQQHQTMLQDLQTQNETLKEILRSYGIAFEAELERRKAEYLHQHPRAVGLPAGENLASSSTGSPSNGFSASHHGILTTPRSTFSTSSPDPSGPERIDSSKFSQFTPSPVFQACSAEQPGSLDFSSKGDMSYPSSPIPLPGIFEEDPQLGIDLILSLEAPCRDHTEYLCRLSADDHENESFFSGHALMASCPPPSHIDNVPDGNQYPHQTYDLPTANLETLLNLSRQLITEGQVTPIMILQALRNHEMYPRLTREDVKIIIETLNTKIRCYGFGAVIEDFELRDCLSSVLGSKVTSNMTSRIKVEDEALYA